MTHFSIDVSKEDAESLLQGATPSQDMLASVYREVYKHQLQQFNDDELRDEIERVFDPELITDLLFSHVLDGQTHSRDFFIEVLADIAFDAYEIKSTPTPNQ